MTVAAGLVVGPLLRYTGRDDATVWVETSRPGEVEVLDHRASTFTVAGHHMALVVLRGLPSSSVLPYEVRLDGELVWPRPDDPRPAPVIRTRGESEPLRIAFGSCRAAAPNEEPWTLPATEHELGYGPDMLTLYARRLRDLDHEQWPDLLLLLGDQVYADAASPAARAFARSRRDTSKPPYEDVADFEEYTRLYQESWTSEDVRWLLSTVPSAMIFDDHDVIDDWNISASWVQDMRRTAWWDDRITGAFASYWCYQHLGNLAPDDLAEDELFAAVQEADDAGELLLDFGRRADRDPGVARWSYDRNLGRAHLVVVDSRAGRILSETERDMLDDNEWSWLEERLREPTEHLLVASSLPVLLPQAAHDVERWNEAVCNGAWGRAAARAGEAVRRAIDLEHWSAFGRSFDRLTELLRRSAAGLDGFTPSTLAILSGDVHNGYVTRGTWDDVELPVWQLVSSPLRQGMERSALFAYSYARSSAGRKTGELLRRGARMPSPRSLTWDMVDGPVFQNHIATLEFPDGAARFRLQCAVRDGDDWTLETTVDHPLR